MRCVRVPLVLATSLILQIPSHAAGPRVAPVPEPQRTSEQQSIAARFASTDMPNAVATYLNHPALADHILPYEHNSAGVQLDANMADFRFPASLR